MLLGPLLCGTFAACGEAEPDSPTMMDTAFDGAATSTVGGPAAMPTSTTPGVSTDPAANAVPPANTQVPAAAPTVGANPAAVAPQPVPVTPQATATPTPTAPQALPQPDPMGVDPTVPTQAAPTADTPMPDTPIDEGTPADGATPDEGVDVPAEPDAPTIEEALTGEQLYAVNCSVCHGADALGGELGPGVRYSDSGFAHFLVREGRESMTYPAPMIPIGEEALTDAEVDLIVDYLWSFPKPTTGEELFLQVCSGCHGADGRGGPTGRSVAGEGHAAERLVRNGHSGAYDDRREFMPSYDQQQITDQELQLLIAHLDSL